MPIPPRTFASFAHRDYRLLWLTICGTSTNQWMEQVLLGWLAYDLTGNPLALSGLSLAGAIPTLVLGPLGGLAADRMHRPRLLLASHAVSLAAVAVLLAASTAGGLTIVQLYAFAAVSGGVWAFSQPVRQALLPALVPADRLSNAVALQSAGFQFTRMVAPGVAGVLLAGFGPTVILSLEVLLAALVMLAAGSIRTQQPPEPSQRESILTSHSSAIAYLRGNPPLLAVILIGFVPTLTATPYQTLLPVFAREVLQVGPEGYGVLASMSGWGAAAVTLTVATVAEIRGKGRLIALAGMAQGVVLLVLALSAWLPAQPMLGFISPAYLASAFTLAVMGACVMTFNTLSTALVQHLCNDHMRGRVMSLFLLDIGIAPLGNAWTGLLASVPLLGVPVTYAAMGVVTLVGMLPGRGAIRRL
ncbi:MAG: MFS transporter [Dehalococcoidia bacterium]|nr:MFS transporter [Dehalococcoidia bacterium]